MHKVKTPFFYIFYTCLFVAGPCSLLFSQEAEQNPSSELIRDLEGQLRGNSPNYAQIEEQARGALQAYYSQFPQEKQRTAYERQSQNTDHSKLSKNALRLLSQLGERRLGPSYFLGERPDLFRLHVVLARTYEGRENSARALSEYAMAFRYVKIEPPGLEEQALFQDLKTQFDREAEVQKNEANDLLKKDPSQEEQKQNKITDAEKQARYLWIKSSFANQDRQAFFAKEEEPEIQNAAQRFSEELERHQELREAYKKAREQTALARIKETRGENTSPGRSEALKQSEDLKQQLQQSKNNLESIRTGAYRNYVKKRREFYGDAAYRMALAVKRLDFERYAFFVQSKGSSYLQGRGKEQSSLEEKTLEPSSSALQSALELAHKINPFHLEYIRLLADEKRRASKIKEALFFTHLYLYLAGAQKQEEQVRDLAYYTLRLAGLYTEQANYSKAIESYEKYFRLEESEEQKLKAKKTLADLHYKRGQNIQRAKELYLTYLQNTEELIEKEKDPKQKNELHALRCESYKSLAAIARREQFRKQTKEYLEEAREEFALLEKEKERQEEGLKTLKGRLRKLQKQLRNEEREELQRVYYKLKDKEIPEKQGELNWLKSRLTALILQRSLNKLPGSLTMKGFGARLRGFMLLYCKRALKSK